MDRRRRQETLEVPRYPTAIERASNDHRPPFGPPSNQLPRPNPTRNTLDCALIPTIHRLHARGKPSDNRDPRTPRNGENPFVCFALCACSVSDNARNPLSHNGLQDRPVRHIGALTKNPSCIAQLTISGKNAVTYCKQRTYAKNAFAQNPGIFQTAQ